MIATLIAALAAVPAAPAAPAAAPPPQEVRIPMARFSLRSFRTVGRDTVYLEDGRHNWYRATLVEDCWPLPNALRIAFDTYGSSTLDNTSSLIVEGQDCRIHSLVRSDPPPRRRRHPDRP